MRRPPDKTTIGRAFSLVELLASMGIFAVLMLVLALMLESSLNRFRRSAERIEQTADTRAVADWMERDLAGVFANRSAALPRLPDSATAVQREYFEKRVFMPFEVDRASGTGSPFGRSFANAADGFSSIAFVTLAPNPSIAGYYVAFARHSPLAGDNGAGMKLFRHFRRGGHESGLGYADGILRSLSARINDAWIEPDPARSLSVPNEAAVRQGNFANSELPFIFSTHRGGRMIHPWPALPVPGALRESPPSLQPDRGSAADWTNPESPVHDSVFSDESVCDHVVRFEIHPWRIVRMTDGRMEVMDAAALNDHLGIGSGDEWPVLVTPDFLDVTISVIPEANARRLSREQDWRFDWSDPGTANSDPRLQGMRTEQFRIHLPRRDS